MSQPSPAPLITLRGVTKTYTIWDDPSARLLAPLRRLWSGSNQKTEGRLFTAVKDVSLEMVRGECLGIIGRNGAGKSTLLQMIAGTVRPTQGEIEVHGRVAALLELGSGFNPDFTGRENIHLNAAILGLTQAEIAAKYDAIVDYSGIEEFIDQPVRTYSSGMTLRLAFAVCVHVDADIVIIDEALAVGDARFQFKCHATLEQMLKEGRTIIFVSHDTNAIKRMCRSAILLERGEVLLQGSPNDVTNIYTKLITSPHGIEAIREDIAALKEQGAGIREQGAGSKEQDELPLLVATSPAFALDSGASSVAKSRQRDTEDGGRRTVDGNQKTVDSGRKTVGETGAKDGGTVDPLALGSHVSTAPATSLLTEERAHRQISDKEYAYGGELGRIHTVVLTDANDQPRLTFLTGSPIRVRINCHALSRIDEPIYALTLKDVRGQEIFGTNTYFQNQSHPFVSAGSEVEVLFEVQLNVQPGVYFISLGWVRLVNAEVQVIHRRYDVLRFDVLPRDRSFGLAYCPTRINVRQLI
jgi:ABC-type polysaccharide/polyol phosphate transport system ATPase subunit